VDRPILACLAGTLVLRFSSGLTAAMLVYYLADLPRHGGPTVDAFTVALLTAAFFATELVLSPILGVLSDRIGHGRLMPIGPLLGAVAVVLTAVTTDLGLLGITRLLEGAAAAASIPSILGFLAMATSHDEALRGRVSARFEAVTVAGIGAGIAAAGAVYTFLGPAGFLLNAVIYGLAFVIYRQGVPAADLLHARAHSADGPATEGSGLLPGETRDLPPGAARYQSPRGGALLRYRRLLRTRGIWLLAPTWICLNAALGLYTSQSLFQLVKARDPRFPDQLLVGGFTPLEISGAFVVAGLIFFAGLAYWGDRFARYRRTTIIAAGIGGGAILAAAALALNHSGELPVIARVPMIVAGGAGLFVLAGATPAALGLLADISEASPDDRGAIMGMYSVFLGLGQVGGLLLGGVAADLAGLDGVLVATFALLVLSLPSLMQLRGAEHQVGRVPDASAAP